MNPSVLPRTAALAVLGAGLAIAGCGDGPTRSQTRDVKHDFQAIELHGDANLRVHIGSPRKVVVSAGERRLDDIETDVRGDTLRIDTDDRITLSFGGNDEVDVDVTVPSLAELRVKGSADADLEGLTGERFHLDVSGSAEVTGTGAVDELEVDVSGSGDGRLYGVDARRVDVDVSGSGDIEVTARDTLEAEVSGAGDVTYRGRPRVQSDVSGSGDVSSD